MQFIVGLGNPGLEYEKTRHNTGFMAVDVLAEKLDVNWKESKKFNALVARTENLFLIKPLSYMNLSGDVVQTILDYYHARTYPIVDNQDLTKVLTVVHDDVYINLGEYKITDNSRSAGHNGAQSIINALGTKNFKRIRIGIKTDLTPSMSLEKFVLGKLEKEEQKTINTVVERKILKILSQISTGRTYSA